MDWLYRLSILSPPLITFAETVQVLSFSCPILQTVTLSHVELNLGSTWGENESIRAQDGLFSLLFLYTQVV
jgi:hypothetical protein